MRGVFTLFLSTILIASVLCLSGCSTHGSVINYEAIEEFSIQPEVIIGSKALGEVKGKHRGPAWDGCAYSSKTAVWKMIRKAKEIGGNAVGDIHWRDGQSPDPRCKRRWWYIPFVFPILLPGFIDAEVCGTAYYVLPEDETALYIIPDDPAGQERLVRRIVAECPFCGSG